MTLREKTMRRTFTPEFREQAVRRVLAGHKAAAVARELDIGESLLTTGSRVIACAKGRTPCTLSKPPRFRDSSAC